MLQQAGFGSAPPVRRGRGVSGNVGNRFERFDTEPFDDGWATILEEQLAPAAIATTLTRDRSRSALSWNDSPDLGFDRSVNPYRGCEHGCVYCYARPSHSYLGYSPGLDFETRLTFKPEIAQILERELRRPGYTAKPVTLGSNTDPYQPVDRTLALTRQVLEVLERFGHPLSIVTKSAGVIRDIDILGRMAARGLVRVWLSITTLDPVLARRMEPRAATPERRLAAVTQLSAAGIPAGVLAAPMIPGLNDAELERILAAASTAGAAHARYVLLRLPLELRQMFETWLQQHYPARAKHVLNLIRETREGQLNDSRFGERFRGTGPYADLLSQRFRQAALRNGLTEGGPLVTTHFAQPDVLSPGDAAPDRFRRGSTSRPDNGAQLALF
ncbi:PA0069 family radical SAM protein [Lichenicola sp.]|uniref:PA0069 family radical SAM protein n=1 Tax=Lichenicola sp. TaxID=2804529 RepID=UPI003B006AB6